jgi:hypothetical protein
MFWVMMVSSRSRSLFAVLLADAGWSIAVRALSELQAPATTISAKLPHLVRIESGECGVNGCMMISFDEGGFGQTAVTQILAPALGGSDIHEGDVANRRAFEWFKMTVPCSLAVTWA